MNHLHIGSGAFGLGFSVALSKASGNHVAVVNRKSDSTGGLCLGAILKNKTYTINYSDGYLPQNLTVDACHFYEKSTVPNLFSSFPTKNERLLITTSVKTRAALLTYFEIFRGAIAAIKKGVVKTPIYFMAMENAFTSKDSLDFLSREFPEEAGNLSSHFVFVDVVVDRICSVEITNDKHVNVHAERYAKLYVSKNGYHRGSSVDISRVSKQLILPNDDNPIVEFAKERLQRIVSCVDDIEQYRRMKLVILNGSHTIIALKAFDHKFVLLDDFVKRNRNWCEFVLAEMAAVASVDPFIGTIDGEFEQECLIFSKETLARFEDSIDYVERVLQRFIDPWLGVFDELFELETNGDPEVFDYLSEFFRNLQKKVVEPMIVFEKATGQTPRVSLETFLIVTTLLTDARYVSMSVARDPKKIKNLMQKNSEL